MKLLLIFALGLTAFVAAVALWPTSPKVPSTQSPTAEQPMGMKGPGRSSPSADQADATSRSGVAGQPSEKPTAAFTAWAALYLATPPAEQPALIAEGVRRATERRPVFKKLIQDDPRRALSEAVPMVVRQQLPAEILAHLEQRVNGVGALRVYQGVPAEGEPVPARSLTFREVEMRDGPTYRAYVFGRRAETVQWTPGASLNGVALDADMAVNEDPFRVLEVGEKPDTAKSIASLCPVSGKSALAPEAASAPVAETTPAVETATETLFFCDGSHITLYKDTLIMAEGGSGGAFGFTGILPAVPTPSIGIVRVLFMPVTYADQNGVPCTEAKGYEMLRDVSEFYAKSSYGKLTLVPVVTPPIKLPHTEAWYIQRDTSNGGDIDGEGTSHNHARTEARRLGFDDANYDCVVMRHSGGPGAYGGLGGGSSVWIRGDGVSTLAHEIGHCFALAHANFWDTAGTSAIGAGTNAEYGDTYDNMGSGGFPAAQYNAQAKFQVKWLPEAFVQRVTQSGLYRIYAFDQTALDPSNRYAMTIVKDAQRTYWGEVRSLFTANPWTEKGMILGWRFPSGGGNNVQLIDTTPGTPTGNNSKDDAPISLGSTFSDFEAGIHLTTVHVNASPRYAEVVVNIGTFPANQAPTLSLAASAEFVPVGATVTFTATANDPDGDPLAYAWQRFGDTTTVVEPSAPVITRTFATAGTYVVTCTASDMKGGKATRSRLITVGSGNGRFTISGRVTLLGQGMPDVIVRANGANGVLTDSDGHYTIPNLTANTYTMSPLLYGYTFGELFENAVVVGPNFTGADFEATADGVVTIAASLPTANELAPVIAGRFTLTRTGDLSSPLTVNVNAAQGSATIATDYTLAPAYVAGSQGFSTFTIPADAATLNVVVTPVVDAAPEGPEIVTLQLGPGAGYVVGAPASATVTIADDDTALPKVSVAVAPASIAENSASPAVVTFTTAAPVGANLTINYSVSGTASAGTDFTALSGIAIIPTGASAVTVNVAPLNDAISEPLETVRLATTANAAYLISPQATSATVNFVDDDVQTVNVAATDPSATEVDLTAVGAAADTGTFLITRSGDISQALTVYYAVSGTNGAGQAALHGVDYEALPGVLSIPAGQASASVTILPRFDGIGEGNENVLLQLGAGPTNYILGASASATVTIADAAGDKPVIEIIPLTSATEGGAGTFRMSVRGAGTGTLAVNFSLAGTATVTTDYTVTTNATLTFDPGTLTGVATFTLNNGAAVTKDVAIVALNDPSAEALETVEMNITPNAAYQTFAPTATASMWLRDADQPTVYVDTQVGTSANTISTFTEGATTTPVKFYLSRTGATTNALTVNYTVAGTATNGTDYTALPGSVTIPAGALGADVLVAVTNDALAEGTETIEFTLAAGSYAAGNSAVMFIADNETVTQTVAFSATSSRALEDAGAVNVPVTLGSVATAPVTVEYIVDSGTRAATSASFSTTLPYWVRVERIGTSFRAYRSPTGATWTQLGATQTMDLPTEVLAGLAVSSRNDGVLSTAVFDSVTFSVAPGGPLQGRTVGFVTEQGSDSIAGGVYTVIGSGAGLNASSQDECHFLAAPVTGDFTLTARVVSQTGGNATQEAGVMIRENASYRARMIHCGAQGTSGLEMIARTSTFTNAFGVGIDHTLTSGTLTFAIGEQVKDIAFNVLDDTINEPNENLAIVLRNPNAARLGTITQHIFTIEDNDLPPAVPFVGFAAATSSTAETAGTAQVLVALTAPATAPVTVDFAVTGGTALTPDDFTLASGTLAYAVGESVKAITVTIADDVLIEDPETIAIDLSNPAGAVLGSITSHTLIINDGDRPVISIAGTDPFATEAGDTGTFTFTRTGPPVGNLTVNFTRTGSASSGTDFTAVGTSIVIADTQTSATITLTPIPDTANEGSETVILTLAADAAYTVGTPSAATVTILDDDRSLITIVSTDPSASETPGDTGQFTITRTAPITGTLTVNLTITGTATNGTDYTSIATTTTFTAGQASRTVTITPTNDTATEGPEVVTMQIASGSYDIGAPGYDDVTIADNDNPPTLYIASPTAQGPLVATGNGVFVSAVVTDDGAPSPVLLQWSQVNGPGTATFDSPMSATSGVTFTAEGTYVLRITANDGQFTVSDQISVNVGAAIGATAWISQDINPSSSRRGQSGEVGGVFTVSGTGAGYAGTADGAHAIVRQVSGDSSIVARVTALTGTGTPLTGLTIRDTMYQGARRAVLGYEPVNGVRFRTRTTTSTADTTTTSVAATLPVWLRLERNATTNEITASFAPDNAGAPGVWTQVGAPTMIAMDAAAELGLTTTSNSTSTTATGVFDHVTLTPAPVGIAVLSEDEAVAAPAAPGSANVVGGTYTIAGPPGSGYFHGWQYHGDLMVTAKHADATTGAGSARSSICIRESMQSGANAVLGRIPVGSYSGFTWTSIAGGASGGVPTFTGKVRWVRLIRRGNLITAFHAADVAGAPGAWAQVGQPQTVIMPPAVLVGFTVNNNSGVGLNTATFTNLSIVPLHHAPIVDAGTVAGTPIGSTPLNGTVTDDDAFTTLWTASPGIAFASAGAIDTSATFTLEGPFTLRLTADDGSVRSFDTVTFNGYASAFSAWQGANFIGGSTNANAGPLLDPDFDGRANLMEYACGTDPNAPSNSGLVYDTVTVGSDKFLRVTITKNPAATGVTLAVQCTSTLPNAASWSSTGVVTEQNNSTTLRVRDSVPIGSTPRFIRASVSQ